MTFKKMLCAVLAVTMLMGTMGISAFAAEDLPIAVDGVITLTEDVVLSTTLTISGDVTIDLNGHKITSANITDEAEKLLTLIKINNAKVEIIDSVGGGKIVPGVCENLYRYNNDATTIEIYDAVLTVNGAIVEGQHAINTKYAGHAIKGYRSSINIINGAVVKGGYNEKKDIENENTDVYYKNQGNSGKAIYSYGCDVVVTDSFVYGGNGIATGSTKTTGYISGGSNQAYGGIAAELRSDHVTSKKESTLTATNSEFHGGTSALYEPGDALSIQGKTVVTLDGCKVYGGYVDPGMGNYGIGGDGLYLSGTPTVSVKDSTIVAGTGLSGTKNGALEIASWSADPTVIVENSTLDGGKHYAIGGSGTMGDFTLIDTTIKGESELIETGTVSSITVEGKLTIAEDSGSKDIAVDVITTTGATIFGADNAPEVKQVIAEINGTQYFALQDAFNNVGDGETIELVADVIELENTISFTKDITFTLDGNNKTIRPSASFTATDSAFNVGQGNNEGTRDTRNYNFKDIVFDGWTTNHVLRCQGITTEITGCTFQNCVQTGGLGLLTLTWCEASVEDCDFLNNTSLQCIDVNSWGDGSTASVEITGCTFTENTCTAPGVVYHNLGDFAISGCTFQENTVNADINGATLFLSDVGGSDFSATGNNFISNTVTTTGGQIAGGIHVGKGSRIANNTYTGNTANGTESGDNAAAIFKGLSYYSFDLALELAEPGDVIYYPNGSKYLVPEEADGEEGEFTVIFDFGGGTDADGFACETLILKAGDALNAPTDLERDGFIFRGWDKEIPEKAYAPDTYTAVWVDEADYKFRTVLTPVGGTVVSANSIKIDPNGGFIIEVSVEDMNGEMPWNVAEITMSYNKTLFKWNQIGSSVEEDTEGNLVFKVFGEDKVDGKVAKQISFTALNPANPDTYVGKFKVEAATVDTGWAANTIDATPIAEEGTAEVYIYYTFDVTLGDGLTGPATATTDANYIGTIDGYDDNYEYVMTGTSGNEDLDITFDEHGTFTVTKEQIVGDMVINVVRTGLKGITADDVELYEYVGEKYVLVLLNADKTRGVYTYNGAIMYATPHYDTANGAKTHYGYLVKGTNFTLGASGLNSPENKAIALANLGLHKTATANLSLGNAEVGDVNNTTNIDVNDIQAVWNCYNVELGNDGAGINVNMPLYLRADICGANASDRDKKVDSADVNAVRTMYDCKKAGGTVTVTPATLAKCGTDGTTYSITCGETVIVKSETISAKDDPTVEHTYTTEAFEGEGANTAYVKTCDCGNRVVTPMSELFSTLFESGDKIYGTINVDTAEELMIVDKLDKEDKLAPVDVGRVVININDDIDLAGYTWYPMNGRYRVINGNGNTISNITAEQGAMGRSGFVGYGGACTINNLTIENITAEGSQVGAFFGQSEGGKLVDCTLKGDVNLTWAQNTTSSYVEEWGAIGMVVGIAVSKNGDFEVTIDSDVIYDFTENGRTTGADNSTSYSHDYRPYVQFSSASTTAIFTDNRPNA